MRSPVLLGAGAGLLVVLLALLTAVTLLASVPLQVGDLATGGPGGSGTSATGTPVAATVPPTGAPRVTATPGSGLRSSGAGTTGAPTSSAAPAHVGTAVGDLAPPLVVDRLGGGTIDLAALRGHPVWVNFMATWCPPCRAELPLMQGYQAELGDRLTIVLVDVREASGTVAEFARSLGITLPIGLDTAGRAQQSWSAYALPVHYWIDASGVVRAVAFGSLGPPQFQSDLQTVLPGVQLKS